MGVTLGGCCATATAVVVMTALRATVHFISYLASQRLLAELSWVFDSAVYPASTVVQGKNAGVPPWRVWPRRPEDGKIRLVLGRHSRGDKHQQDRQPDSAVAIDEV